MPAFDLGGGLGFFLPKILAKPEGDFMPVVDFGAGRDRASFGNLVDGNDLA